MYINKNEIRSLMKDKCIPIDKIYRNWASQQIINFIKPLVDKATNIGIYRSYAWEISVDEIIKYAISCGKLLYQPISFKNTKKMLLEPYIETNTQVFSKENYKPSVTLEWYNLDLIFIPVMAVDICGNRLGKGGGYYDTTLSDIINLPKRPILCGVGFNSQFLSEPMVVDSWDISLDYFLSETGIIEF